jgi:hypothetical protein
MPHAGFPFVGRPKAFLSILELKWKDRHAAVPCEKNGFVSQIQNLGLRRLLLQPHANPATRVVV